MKKVLQKTLSRLQALLLLVVMFIGGGNSAAWAEDWQTVYSNALSTTDGLTIINNNNDESTWQSASADYVQYSFSGAWYKADDYMIFPAQSLEAGKTYRVSFEYSTYVSWGPEKYAVLYGSSNTAEAMTNTIIAEKQVNVGSYTTEKQTFTVSSSGNVYISIVARSEYNMGYLYIKNYKLEVDADSGTGGGTGDGGNLAPSFPEKGVAYQIALYNSVIFPAGGYLNVGAGDNCTTYNTDPEALYFTWDDTHNGFTIEDAEGNYIGQGSKNWICGSTTKEYWTVEEITTGVFAFKGSQGYLGFNTNTGIAFRDMVKGGYKSETGYYHEYRYTIEEYGNLVTYTIDITNATGASVTICGEAVTGDSYTATKTLQSSDIVVTGAPAGYKAEVAIENETITITWVEIPKTSITGYNDAPGTYSLDVKVDGFNNFIIYFADNFAENYNYQNLPQLLCWTLPAGASAGSYPYANSGGNQLTVTLNNAKVAGDYHLTIPASTLSFEGGKTNPAIDLTWTLTAASMFSIGYDDTEAIGVEGSNYAMKTLTGFNITAPDGVVFDYLSSSNCSVKLQGMYDPSISDYPLTDVVADWTLENGVVSIRFAEPYTVEGNYYFRIGEGAIVATDGRSNKSFNVSATVDPHDYFDFTFNETEFEGAFNTFTLTLPEGVTAASIGEFEASYWDNAANKTLRFTISDAEFTQTGRQLAVNFTAPAIPVDQNFSVIFEEGSIATTDANQISNYKPVYNLHVRPVRMHFVKMGVDSDTNSIERGAMIEEVTTLFVCFDEPIATGDDQWLSAAQAGATLTDANGNDVGFYSGSFYCVNYGSNGDNAVLFAKLSQTVSTPGVYTFHLPANVYTSTNGHKNEAVEFTFEIGAMPLEITNVSISATEGGVAMPITVNFSQKVMLAEEYEGNVYLQKKTESGYVDVTLDNYGWTTISDYYYNGWYGDVTYYNYAYINLYDADGSYGSFHSLEAGDYRLVIDKDIFTSVKGRKLEADYYYDFTVTAVPSAAVAGALDGKYYGTYYASRNWIVPEGVTAYYIDAVNNGELHLVKIADAGGVVNGSIGVLLESTEAIAKAPIAYTSQNGDIWANDNMLRGTTADQLITNDSWDIQYKYYMLSRKNGVVGFYWDPSTSDEGESLNNKANKAYLRVPVGIAAASALRIVVDENELTCIDSVAGVDSNADIYDLQGKRVVAPKGGVYVKNGKKFSVK